MIKQFKVILMNVNKGLKNHIVNCNSEICAIRICNAIYPNMRVIEIFEIKWR